MRVRLRAPISGTFHGIEGGVARGQIVDIDDDEAMRYIGLGLCEPEAEPHRRPLDGLRDRLKARTEKPKTLEEKWAEIAW